jgi:hypothetical protein
VDEQRIQLDFHYIENHRSTFELWVLEIERELVTKLAMDK